MSVPRILLLTVLATLLSIRVAAGDDDDHERARRAREAGEIVPLTAILDQIDASFDGQVIEVELEREGKKWVYEVELLTKAGNIIELTYDAATRELLEAEGRGLEAARKKR